MRYQIEDIVLAVLVFLWGVLGMFGLVIFFQWLFREWPPA